MCFISLIITVSYLFKIHKYKIASVLTILQVVSLIGTYLAGMDRSINTISTLIAVLFNIGVNIALIVPWKSYDNVRIVEKVPNVKIEKLTKYLLMISLVVFVFLSITSVVVQLFVQDINQFKYGEEGNYVEFFYSQLPFDVRFLIIANSLYYFSYFLIPLHFYYMVKGNWSLAWKCGLLSTNIILFGLTFFSRWTVVLFISLYVVYFILFKNNISKFLLRKEIKIISVIVTSLLILFISITVNRFQDDGNVYATSIPKESKIQDPTLYSIFDYVGQAFPNGIDMLEKYHGPQFNCKYALSYTNNFFSSFGLIPKSDFQKVYQKLWPNHWWKFTGVASISIWDFGILFTVILLYVYRRFVILKNKNIDIKRMMFMVILIQMPLCSIFYSLLPSVIFLLIIYWPINVYLSIR